MNIKNHEFRFRNYILSFQTVVYNGQDSTYLCMVSKANSHYRMTGRKTSKVTSREQAARYLQAIRHDLNGRWAKNRARLQEKREAKQNFVNPYFVGQILYTSWGYDQTNIEYYQVTAVGKMSITCREITCKVKETSFMSGPAVPQINEFCGPEFTAIIQIAVYSGKPHTHVNDRSGHGMYETSLKDINEGITCSWYA